MAGQGGWLPDVNTVVCHDFLQLKMVVLVHPNGVYDKRFSTNTTMSFGNPMILIHSESSMGLAIQISWSHTGQKSQVLFFWHLRRNFLWILECQCFVVLQETFGLTSLLVRLSHYWSFNYSNPYQLLKFLSIKFDHGGLILPWFMFDKLIFITAQDRTVDSARPPLSEDGTAPCRT